MNSLSKAVLDELYSAFADEPRPSKVDGCPCCVDADECAQLVAAPLRQITPQQLGKYASSVFLTVGSEADFRYFLPRILEVLATEPAWWPQPEVVGRAMANIPWEEYTPIQQRVLMAYFDTIFEQLFDAREPDGWEMDSWLCCSSYVLPEWKTVLDRLLARPKALVKLYEWHSEPLQKQRLGNGFWDDSPKRETFLDWLLSSEMQKVLMTEWGL